MLLTLPGPFLLSIHRYQRRLSAALLSATVLFSQTFNAAAQGEIIIILQTGGGQPLVSQSRSFPAIDSSNSALQFTFGFSSEETPVPDTFLDSLTITLQAQDASSLAAIYLTVDSAGIFWAPPTPGTIVLNPQSIQRSPVPYPILIPALPNQSAFAVTALIPPQLLGRPLGLHFDLFDNQNALRSQGFFRDLSVVPEPSTYWLGLLGLAGCILRKKLWP